MAPAGILASLGRYSLRWNFISRRNAASGSSRTPKTNASPGKAASDAAASGESVSRPASERHRPNEAKLRGPPLKFLSARATSGESVERPSRKSGPSS